jgi:hypothetical protein
MLEFTYRRHGWLYSPWQASPHSNFITPITYVHITTVNIITVIIFVLPVFCFSTGCVILPSVGRTKSLLNKWRRKKHSTRSKIVPEVRANWRSFHAARGLPVWCCVVRSAPDRQVLVCIQPHGDKPKKWRWWEYFERVSLYVQEF